jgi:NAD(P)-dependent dehydrogenase (short-subunit alcohol dehydrogenase family)
MDVTDAQSVRNAAMQLKDVAIDVLINSAGIAGASGQKTGNVDYQSWAHVLDVNTMGPLRVLESFSDHIARSERKLVITRRGPSAPEPGNGTNLFRVYSLAPSRAVGDRPGFAARPA